jgi:hypothetical protein
MSGGAAAQIYFHERVGFDNGARIFSRDKQCEASFALDKPQMGRGRQHVNVLSNGSGAIEAA